MSRRITRRTTRPVARALSKGQREQASTAVSAVARTVNGHEEHRAKAVRRGSPGRLRPPRRRSKMRWNTIPILDHSPARWAKVRALQAQAQLHILHSISHDLEAIRDAIPETPNLAAGKVFPPPMRLFPLRATDRRTCQRSTDRAVGRTCAVSRSARTAIARTLDIFRSSVYRSLVGGRRPALRRLRPRCVRHRAKHAAVPIIGQMWW